MERMGRRVSTHLLDERVDRRPKRPHARRVAGNGCRSPLWYRGTWATWRTGLTDALVALRDAALRDGSGVVCLSDIASRDTRLLDWSGSRSWWSCVGGCRRRRRMGLFGLSLR